jgi:tetratricopeptide (TPR) repeat protein
MLFRLFLVLIFGGTLLAQEVNIVPQLKLIEQGEAEEAKSQLKSLLNDNPTDPSVKFLEAVLSEDGNRAVEGYEYIINNHPNSNYADASLYRYFSYSYSLGAYKKAQDLKNKLLSEYPSSPYVKAVNRDIPDETISETITPLSETKTSQPTSEPLAKYTIQAGAFLNVTNARKLNTQFKDQGYHSTIFPKTIGGSILNVVTVGKFASKAEADKFLVLLKNEYKLNGRIISL